MSRVLVAIVALAGCARPECAPANYRYPECRVQAEWELSRLVTSEGVEVHFEDPGAEVWDARGLLHEDADGAIYARLAGLGTFRLTLSGPAPSARVRLDNVHPSVPPLAGEQARHGLVRELEVDLPPGGAVIEGGLPAELCRDGFRLAAFGDVQKNPLQLRRIVADLHAEAARAEDAGTPLLGLIFLGDLSETSARTELRNVRDLLASAPIPTATTPGNHDVYDAHDAVYNETFGPGTHAFDVCGARVVLLDSGSGSLASSVVGRLPELLDGQASFLLAGMHHPPFAGGTSAGWTAEDQAQLLLAELAARDADLVLAGHLHRRMSFPGAPVPQIVVGTGGASQYAVDPDYGYLRMTFTDELDTCFVQVPTPGSDGEQPARRAPETCVE